MDILCILKSHARVPSLIEGKYLFKHELFWNYWKGELGLVVNHKTHHQMYCNIQITFYACFFRYDYGEDIEEMPWRMKVWQVFNYCNCYFQK